MRNSGSTGTSIATFILAALTGLSGTVPPTQAQINSNTETTVQQQATQQTRQQLPTNYNTQVISDNRIMPGGFKYRRKRRIGHAMPDSYARHTNRKRCSHNAKVKRRKHC